MIFLNDKNLLEAEEAPDFGMGGEDTEGTDTDAEDTGGSDSGDTATDDTSTNDAEADAGEEEASGDDTATDDTATDDTATDDTEGTDTSGETPDEGGDFEDTKNAKLLRLFEFYEKLLDLVQDVRVKLEEYKRNKILTKEEKVIFDEIFLNNEDISNKLKIIMETKFPKESYETLLLNYAMLNASNKLTIKILKKLNNAVNAE